MGELEENTKSKGDKNKITNIPVQFLLGKNNENISITTNKGNKPTQEEIITKAFKYHSQGNIYEAIRFYKLFIEEGFIDPRVFANYGIIMNNLNKLEEAEILTRKAIELKPDFFQAHNNMGNILKDLGKFKEAEISYSQAIKIKPDLATAHSNLGIILQELGRYEEAISSFNKAYKLNPKNPKYYGKIGLKSSDLYKQKLTENFKLNQTLRENNNLMESINNYDWETSIKIIKKICREDIQYSNVYTSEFTKLWCTRIKKLINEDSIHILLPILIELILINEINEDINNLIKYLFERYDFNSILKLVNHKDKICITLSFCEYKFLIKDFSDAEVLASNNIKNAQILLKEKHTESLAWLIIRRSLKLFRNKELARNNFKKLINNIIN